MAVEHAEIRQPVQAVVKAGLARDEVVDNGESVLVAPTHQLVSFPKACGTGGDHVRDVSRQGAQPVEAVGGA